MNFFVKSLIKKQLNGIPDDQVDLLINAMEKNPEFFKQLADEIQTKVSAGMSQQDAAMLVMKGRKEELKRIVAGNQ